MRDDGVRREEASDPSFATTLAHGLDLLAAFQPGQSSLSNADLALRTGLSRPTISRLSHTLARLGYLRRDAAGRYRLGTRVLAVAYPLLAELKIRHLARPLMREFAAYAGGTVSIATQLATDFVYVETVRTTDAVPHVPEVGFTAPLFSTAVGRALLSLYTDDEFDTYARSMEQANAAEWRRLRQPLVVEIETCRRRGYSLSLGEWRPEIYGVAAPLHRTTEGDCFAVNCGIPAFRFIPEQVERECAPRMLGLARSIRAMADGGNSMPLRMEP